VTVYEARGQYQLIVRALELQGQGALQIAFEKLKQKLQAEGLFASDRKRPLPLYPQCIGLVTSPTGAAIRDILHVIRRRHPAMRILLAPCRVQGQGAAAEIAAAIRLLNEWAENAGSMEPLPGGAAAGSGGMARPELILLSRGGGSLEDLWAFNEEIVARAVFESRLPVVSAVGHEIDFTISDFVADVRAATPSAGAEIITEGVFSSRQFIAQSVARIGQLAVRQMGAKRERLERAAQRLARAHPRRRFNEWLQRMDEAQAALNRSTRLAIRSRWESFRNTGDRLLRVRPSLLLRQRRDRVERGGRRIHELARVRARELGSRVDALGARLRLLGPEQTLARGYSITSDAKTGRVVKDASQVAAGQRLKTRLQAGEIFSRAEGGS